jgi:predicted phage terminase large subunit-like protein
MHISASGMLDKKYIRAIKRELEHNEKIIQYYGKLKGEPWQSLALSVKARMTRKEETLAGAGILTDIIGWHGDLLIIDDPIQDDQPRDLKVRENKETWFDEVILGCVDPNTKVWVIGTRKSTLDLFQYIMKKQGTVSSVRKAIIDEQKKTVLWPQRLDLAWLKKKRAQMGSFVFSREFQNEPVSAEGELLKKAWWQEYGRFPIPIRSGHLYTGVDPALGLKQSADYTAIATIGLHDNRFYLVDLVRGHWSYVKTREMIKRTWGMYTPLVMGLESNFYQRALSQDLIDSTTLPIREIKHIRDKQERIMSTVGVYAEQGKFFIKQNLPLKDALLAEWLDFPNGVHDDCLDAIATALEVCIKPQGAVLFV